MLHGKSGDAPLPKLCWSASSKGENCIQQLRLFFTYLFLRFKHSIDKFFVRDLPVEMLLGHIIVYLEFGVLEKFLSDPCPDVEQRIPVVGHVDADKFCTGREAVTLVFALRSS